MFKFNSKGSTLVIVLIIFSILSVLGMTIMYIGVLNFKMKNVDVRVKTVFYLAEAGQDEVHALIINEVKNAIEHGYKEVDRLLSTKKNEVESSLIDSLFKTEYMAYIRGNLVNTLGNYEYSALDEEIGGHPPKIEVVEVLEFSSNEENKYILKVNSYYELNNISEIVSAEYKVLVPAYSKSLLKKEIILKLIESKYF